MQKLPFKNIFFFGISIFFLFGVLLAAIIRSNLLINGIADPAFPAFVHGFTLGFFVPVTMGLYYQLLPQLFHRPVFWHHGFLVVAFLHYSGTGLLIMGFYTHNSQWIYIGGHHIVSTAIILFGLQFLVTFWRSPQRKSINKFIAWPALGMMLTIGLGTWLAFDRVYGTYHMYHYGFIVPHLLMGGFFFLIPMLLFPRYLGIELSSQWPIIKIKPGLFVLLSTLALLAILFGFNLEAAQYFQHAGFFLLSSLSIWLSLAEWKTSFSLAHLKVIFQLRSLAWGCIGMGLFYYPISEYVPIPVSTMQLLFGEATLLLFVLVLPCFFYLIHPYSASPNFLHKNKIFIFQTLCGLGLTMSQIVAWPPGIWITCLLLIGSILWWAKLNFIPLFTHQSSDVL